MHPLCTFAVLLCVCWAQPAGVAAQPALRSLVHVHRVAPADQPEHDAYAIVGHAGFGVTESVLRQDDSHRRVTAGIGAGVFRKSGWGFALRADGRLDIHSEQGQTDGGLVGDPRAMLRFAHRLGDLWAVGGQVGLWLPGSDAPSLKLKATTPEALLLLSAGGAERPWRVSLNLGGRYDRSGQSIDDAERLSGSDWISLGVSDSSALLAGVGLEQRVGATTLLAEFTWDALLGSDAPDLGTSPARLSAGLRHAIGRVQLSAIAEALLSTRQDIDVDGALYPVEPRFSVLAGLRILLGGPYGASEQSGPPERRVLVFVVTPEEVPIRGAELRLLDDAGRVLRSDSSGRVRIEHAPQGGWGVRVAASGYKPTEARVETGSNTLRVVLEPALPPGQLSLRVRDLTTGKPVAARVLVRPKGETAHSSVIEGEPDGALEIVLLPGEYVVRVEADGYRAQERPVRIEQHGVTVLNLDLRGGP